MTKLAPHEADLTDWLASQKQAMLDLLSEAVNTDSGSYDKAGVDAVGAALRSLLQEQGLLTTIEPHDTFGDAIHVRLDDTRSNESPSCSWAIATPYSRRARRPAARSASRTAAPTARACAT